MKVTLSILLTILILAQNCGLVLYSFNHHHHCSTQNACSTHEASCIPANDDCSIAQKLKDFGKQANNKDGEKQFCAVEYIFVEDQFVFTHREIGLAEESNTFNCCTADKLLWQVKNVPYPPPNC
ncbi:MAG: hypothetical protein RL660_2319 [Bacteroidota bacterium]